MIGKHGEKQFEALKSFKKMPSVKNRISERSLNPEILIEVENIKEQQQQIDKRKTVYKGCKSKASFTKF